MTEREPCAACGLTTAYEQVWTVRGFAIERCPICRVGRTRVPAGFDPLALYDESYFQGGRADGYADYRGSEAVLRREFRAALAHLTRVGTRGGRLLELGSAYGYFLDEAAAAFRACGVEPAAAGAAACRARGHDVVEGVATEEFLASRGPFDALVLLDVVEHLARPDEVLASLARHCRSGAALLVSTGDWGSLASRLAGRRWRLMTPPQHLWFFDVRSLTALLARAGFRVVDVRRPWKRVPLELMAYQLARALGAQGLVRRLPIPPWGVPVNLFDAVRVVARHEG